MKNAPRFFPVFVFPTAYSLKPTAFSPGVTMKGVYTANIAINGVTEAVTLICLTAPANRVVEVLSASVTQTNGIAVTLGATLTRVGVLGSPDQTSITAHK